MHTLCDDMQPSVDNTVGEATCLPPKRYVPNKREDDILPYEKMKSLRGFHTQLRCDYMQRVALITYTLRGYMHSLAVITFRTLYGFHTMRCIDYIHNFVVITYGYADYIQRFALITYTASL